MTPTERRCGVLFARDRFGFAPRTDPLADSVAGQIAKAMGVASGCGDQPTGAPSAASRSPVMLSTSS